MIGIIQRSINAFEKQINATNMAYAFIAKNYTSSGAYVYTDDDNKNIHLCKAYLPEPEKIDNNAKLCSVKMKNEPERLETITLRNGTTRQIRIPASSYPEKISDINNWMVHECSHFYDIGMLGAGSDKRGLYDLYVKDLNTNKNIGPYHASACKDIASLNPHAALCNADNFALFIAEKAKYDDDDSYSYF